MTWIEGFTLGIAGCGAVLSVINTIYALWKDRVHLKVTLRWWIGPESSRELCVEVVNLSGFEITISEIFIPLSRKEKYVTAELIRDLPKRLEPRAAYTFRAGESAFQHPGCPKRGRVAVVTACGVMRLTNHADLRQDDPPSTK
jgi:hypothetical protein